jgi:two-component system LytT family response regulator
MIINCIIIEDEPLALERLRDYVLQVPFLNLLTSFDNGLKAITYLKKEKVDLMFLDIQMDGITGIQLLETLQKRPDIIITTAYDSYALKGFELNVTDYLLKPFSFERFLQAATRVYDKVEEPGDREQPSFIFIKTEYRHEKVNFDDLLFIEGMRDYRRIHTTDKKIMTLQTFKELEQQLPFLQFCRVHKSFIVALNKIEMIERDRIKIRDELIPVSETFKEDFLRRVNISR